MAKKVHVTSVPQAGAAPISSSSKIEPDTSKAPALVQPVPLATQQPPPPTLHAAHLSIAANIMFEQSRFIPATDSKGNVTIRPAVEWFTTISLSAPIAQHLFDGPQQTLAQYKIMFGPIPKAPPPQTAMKKPS